MTELQFTTVFTFVCARCRHPNEYRQHHSPWVRPHLVSTKCSKCQNLNWLGGLSGTLLPPELSPSSMQDAAFVSPRDDSAPSAKKPAG